MFTWAQGQLVEYTTSLQGVTVSIDTEEDELTLTLSKELTATLPPLCEYRIRLITAGEPEKVMGGNLYILRDGGLL